MDFSDHDIITGVIIHTATKKVVSKTIACYNRANFDAINSELSIFSERFLENYLNHTVNENWVLLKDALTSLISRFVPTIGIKTNNNTPWFNRQLQRLNNKKKRLYRLAGKDRLSTSWLKYKKCDKEYQSLLKTTRRNFYNHDLSSMLLNNPRKFWRVINPRNNPDIILSGSNGATIPESQCAQLLNNAFASVFTQEDACPSPALTLNISSGSPMPEIMIEEAGIYLLLNKLKTSSASDNLGFNNKLLKNISCSMSVILTALFSQSLSHGSIPDDWRIAKVVPFFKSGDRTSPLNYRPISLTNTICKQLEHIIHSQIIQYLEKHNIIYKYQHGFRRGYSCDTQLAGFTHDLHSSLDASNQVDAIFLDFSKAFDRVPHHRLLLKLRRLNIHTNVLAWITDFLSSRTQFTSVNSSNSSFVQVTSGVPQGSVLGPLLFLVYINDLPNGLTSRVRLFADDCVIYRNISSDTDRQALQADLDTLNAWCSDWLMTLNLSKTKCMSFTRSSTRIPTTYFLNNNTLELVSTYKYLGVHFQSNLKWHNHINQTLASANRTLGVIKHNLKQAPSHIRKLAYLTLIRPKIEYASAIWDPSQEYIMRDIESLQNRAVRFIFSDYSPYASVTALKNRAELASLSLRRRHARLTLFHKLYHHERLRDDFFHSPTVTFPRRDHSCKVKRITCHSFTFANSFIPRTIIDWNNLPQHIATEANLTKFQDFLKNEVT